jgi:hypothetical protein
LFRDQFAADSSSYSKYCGAVDAVHLSDIEDLLAFVAAGYDIVHLFCPMLSGGMLIDGKQRTLLGSDLIAHCCKHDVKLLWVANGNKGDDYVQGFRAAGKPLNLIMTLDRCDKRFTAFLEELLKRIATGDRLPIAWVSLAPQGKGPWEQELPSCVFFAGRPKAKLLSQGEPDVV